jgi:hypothetical protein
MHTCVLHTVLDNAQADTIVDAACGLWHTLLLTSEHSVYGMGARLCTPRTPWVPIA